ncbi:FAD-dependent oxidoreductase [Streptomyces sp. NPDC006197]|uniref:FAD-dependent oxidoreductase n=1 Tax=Streptomyces sp. NPDC006197 TaxID=3156685 RepID=UPI0033B0973E
MADPATPPTPIPRLRQPHGRIRFAGGDIASSGAGGIDGAVESGTRTAREIAPTPADGRH